MSLKSTVKKYCPEFLLPVLKVPYRVVTWPYRAAGHFVKIRIIARRALKYLPYYQDELSKDVLHDHIEFYRTGDRNIFIRRAERTCMMFGDIDEVFGEVHKITSGNEKDNVYSGIVVIYDHESNDLDYTCRLLSISEWAGKYRSITLNELLNGGQISENEFAVALLSEKGSKKLSEYIRRNEFNFSIFSGLIHSVREDLQYFDVFSPSENEVIIDAGCYNGKTAIQFLDWGGGRVSHIYSFEFDPLNTEKCDKNLSAYRDKVTLIKKGVWDEDGIANVTVLGDSGSSINYAGDVEVQLTSIDNAVKGEKVTLIKMDIEGAELKALKGAKNTILRNRPRLIICMYHKREDLYELPAYILSLVPEYKFYLRHYGSREYGTVLYAYCE